jgi:hypothetical protein
LIVLVCSYQCEAVFCNKKGDEKNHENNPPVNTDKPKVLPKYTIQKLIPLQRVAPGDLSVQREKPEKAWTSDTFALHLL